MTAYVAGIGLLGPGLPGWAASRPVLAGEAPWQSGEVAPPPPTLLPANERRRAGLPVRLALAVCAEAVERAGRDPADLRGVFGSANGEGLILHELLETLASDSPHLSPTRFHNSVHNAVAGYWAMAVHATAPITCLSAADDTFAATLMKALAELAAEQVPVLLCAYDVPLPDPLARLAPADFPFACAMVLTPEPVPGALATLRLVSGTASADPSFAALAAGNPAARSLPLLAALARGVPAAVPLGLPGAALLVQVEPCSTVPPSPR